MSIAKRQVVLSPHHEALGDLPETLRFYNIYLEQGFKHLEVLTLRKRNLPALLKALEKDHDANISHIQSSDTYYIALEHKGNNGVRIFIYKKPYEVGVVHVAVAYNGRVEGLVEFINTLPLSGVGDPTSIDLSYYYMSIRNGLSNTDIDIEMADMQGIYGELYPDIDIDKLVKSYNQAEEPVLMLYGDPGVGKTSFIKYIISTGEYKKIAYIKDPKVMEDGELWASLTGSNYNLIIFDDLDIGLLPRKKNSESTFMTQLLSYSDGIFTKGKTKVVITTNQAVKEVDSALVRPGRCFDFIRLQALDKEDAKNFWVKNLKLKAEDFNLLFKSNTVTQASLMSEAARLKSVGSRDYIKKGLNQYSLEQKLADLGIQSSNGEGGKTSF